MPDFILNIAAHMIPGILLCIINYYVCSIQILKNEPEVEDVRFHGHDHLCRCNLKSGDAAEAVKQCSEAIRIREEEEPRLYCDRAEAYLDDDMYDEVKFPNGQA